MIKLEFNKEIEKKVEKAVLKSLNNEGPNMKKTAQEFSPKLSGRLQKNHFIGFTKSGKSITMFITSEAKSRGFRYPVEIFKTKRVVGTGINPKATSNWMNKPLENDKEIVKNIAKEMRKML